MSAGDDQAPGTYVNWKCPDCGGWVPCAVTTFSDEQGSGLVLTIGDEDREAHMLTHQDGDGK